MADDVLGQVRSFTDPEYRAQFEQLTKRIATDQQFRDRLAKQPSQTLADFGIKIPSGAKFGERDQLLVRMIGDERIGDMYRAGRIEELQKYLVDNYGKIRNPSGPVESAVADFDVVIEVEAVAVAIVAVAAIAIAAVIVDPAERFRAMEEMTGVQNARIAALEARIRMLEGRIG
jgi:hypothetical protein